VNVNILANPADNEGGKHSVDVVLTPGTYHYHCTISGHLSMTGTLEVTDGGGGEDTTAPTTSAKVSGDQNADGAYVGSASVAIEASDEGAGVDTVEYAIGADGA
ncbi:glycosyl hydrolase, partial [Streptomyces sp. SID11233]|nr:glycosyl hydrolase [Streptomyces sp. SID11233]